MDAFARYAPFIQDFIYRNGWDSLRAVQMAAADAIFNTGENVLLAASTASGKTEAAFFPMLTLLEERPSASVGIVYIAPLKALINDQFGRLNALCEDSGIPVWRWHGDVSSSRKAKLLKKPGGILQITPESLESLLLHKHSAIPRLFGDVRFVVIDEIHSLMRGDRGGQTMCLVERLARTAGVQPRRVGLSATVGDLKLAGDFLARGSGRGTVVPRIQEGNQRWRLSMEHFYTSDRQAPDDDVIDMAVSADMTLPEEADGTRLPKGRTPVVSGIARERFSGSVGHSPAGGASAAFATAGGPKIPESFGGVHPRNEFGEGHIGDGAPGSPAETGLGEACSQVVAEAPTDTAPAAADPGMGCIFEHTRGRKCLVFSNSREEAEAVTTTLRSYCEAVHEPDRFLIHHGNLSSSYRETAEDIMRDGESSLTTVTTATLELGIDIGRLECAFQIDAPFTVSAFLQRMGRTGRRGQPSEMWFVMREDRPEPRALLGETIPWKLLQGIALVQLYLEERWVEPPRPHALPFSLLYHQTMATLASGGEMTPAELAGRVLTLSPFRNVSAGDYRILLRHLLEIDHIQTTDEGGLIVGLAGERVVNSFRFYGVFVESEEYTVRSDSQELGTIVQPPPLGEKIAIAGHTWLVEEIDHDRRVVYCTQVKGQVPAYFGECAGDIHTRILECMARVLAEDAPYPYLMRNAQARLRQARSTALMAGLVRNPLINLGGDTWGLFPWLGSYAFLALERFLKRICASDLGLRGLDSSRPYFLQFRMDASAGRFWQVLGARAAAGVDPRDLLYPGEVPYFEKYDGFVPAELIRKGFALGVLDAEGMLERVRQWTDASAPIPPSPRGLAHGE